MKEIIIGVGNSDSTIDHLMFEMVSFRATHSMGIFPHVAPKVLYAADHGGDCASKRSTLNVHRPQLAGPYDTWSRIGSFGRGDRVALEYLCHRVGRDIGGRVNTSRGSSRYNVVD